MEQISCYVQFIICFFIRAYQYVLSPFITPCCRFYPSCSEYALTAINQWGVWRGLLYTSWRLLRCHPWSQGGFDPVTSKPINEEKL